MRTSILSTCFALGAAAGLASAQPATISFSADNNPDGPTFVGGTGPVDFRDAAPLSADGVVNTTLLLDVNGSAPGGLSSFDTRLVYNSTLTNYQRFNAGSFFIHSYSAAGRYDFLDNSSGSLLLSVIFSDASFSSGSFAANLLGPAATLQSLSPVSVTGSLASTFPTLADWAFTLTNLRTAGGGAVGVSNLGEIQPGWSSDGSYSGTLIPAPGALALAAGAGLAAIRRRTR
jgi:MYXO-CTERM domain-containing protein